MAVFRKMVSMARTPVEKAEAMIADMPSMGPDIPYGLCISLDEIDLEKLDIEEDCEVGDTVHLFALAKVTSVSKRDGGDGPKVRVELCLENLCVESESAENVEMAAAE